MSSREIPISVAVAGCRRQTQLCVTLCRLQFCDPPPAEILVHLDGNDAELRALVEENFPKVRLLHSAKLVGPGGARNTLNQVARCSWVAHFDDDSFPQDCDFFAQAWKLISRYPETAVFCASIMPVESPDPQGLWLQAFYPGCGHLMNRDWFFRTRGYLPLPIAYNLEEVDVSIQLHELGGRCLQSGGLRVIHDHLAPVREDENTQVAMMINTMMFPLLRYPLLLLPQAFGSVMRRLFRLILKHEWRVIGRVLCLLPANVRHYLPRRKPVSVAAAWSWLLLRRDPQRVRDAASL